MSATPTPTSLPAAEPRPLPGEVDVFGVTHTGLVREENADHFLIASLHRTARLHGSSLTPEALGALEGESRGWAFLIADGVGGKAGGAEASATAVRAVLRFLTDVVELCGAADPAREAHVLAELRAGVEHGHEVVKAGPPRGRATTLTMVTIVWPRAFLVHVGDSRCYRLRGDRLEQLTTDQTMAEALRAAGAISAEAAAASRLKDVLWSAIGGSEVVPELRAVDCRRSDVMLLCTDGLTRHLTDDEIAAVLRDAPSAEVACRALVDAALARGGRDNVSVVVARVHGAR